MLRSLSLVFLQYGMAAGAMHAMYFADSALICTNPELSSVPFSFLLCLVKTLCAGLVTLGATLFEGTRFRQDDWAGAIQVQEGSRGQAPSEAASGASLRLAAEIPSQLVAAGDNEIPS